MPGLRLATGTETLRLLLGEFSFLGVSVIMMGNFRERGSTGNERT
ncbi:hypothetical protein KCTCHS21_55970 [Cohnella abietis]|uniref:Uncharacterized protein n=1 Tax=Cohnella abietis TaxID=2507935 RepID=A0A3T1DDZ4_9BACL|nr:hypothetical protein KCTCHS21_55970 [Cohnella abietis]